MVIGVRETASESMRSGCYMGEITYMNKVNVFFSLLGIPGNIYYRGTVTFLK